MTNKEIKDYKQKFADIKKDVNGAEKEQLKERLIKLYEGIKRLQDLADVVCATKYLGTELRGIDKFIRTTDLNAAYDAKGVYDGLYPSEIAICEQIYKELCHNVYYVLQTEEMFNACVLAKWSCFWAAIAAIASCISVLLVLFCA
jgi:predicted TPR repeat methyltransferase